MFHLHRVVFLVSLSVFVFSCSYIQRLVGLKLRAPVVSVAHISLKKLTAKNIKLLVRVKAYNPNNVRFTVDDFRYQLQMDGEQVASGIYREAVTLEPSSNIEINFPIEFSALSASRQLKKYFSQEKMSVKWVGEANFITPLGKISVDFEEEKKFR